MPLWAFPMTLARATEGLPADTEGLENEEQTIPPGDEGVIPPPPTGDEDIYTDAPNPKAGHEEEVVPPSDVPDDDEIIETDTSSP